MSLSYDQLLPHLPAYAAVVSRLAGLLVFAPVLGSPMIPMRIKGLLAIALGAAVYPTLHLHRDVPLTMDLASLAPAMFTEALIGLSIGLIASLPLVCMELGGLLIGQQMGLGLAGFYNPAIDSDADIVGQFLFYAALGVFLAAGGLEQMVRAVVVSFAHVPIGAFSASDSPLQLLVGMLLSGFELAMRVAAPVFAILFVESAAGALIMKTAPQLNVMSIGFPLRIMLGLATLYASLAAVHWAAAGEIERSLDALAGWAEGLATPELIASPEPAPSVGGP